jgi:hypothetical protein
VLSACVDKSQLISRIPLADTCRILQREFAFLEPSSLGNRKTVGRAAKPAIPLRTPLQTKQIHLSDQFAGQRVRKV